MILATRADGSPDGQLIVVSKNYQHYIVAGEDIPTLQYALENWSTVEQKLEDQSKAINADSGAGQSINLSELMAPLPRSWQWLDGSVFPSHSALMDKALGIEPDKVAGRPMMYQGQSDTFYGPLQDVPFVSEEHFIDFEGEFGIIVDSVPAGTKAAEASSHIRLLVQINDWSLRALAGVEMKTGFGWIQAKPPCSMAPFAITPDELGTAWKDHQVHLNLTVHWNDKQFGNAFGGDMEYGFDELVVHAAMTRNLVPGTVIGSGTVSNENYREVGSSCIAERRGIEIVDQGEPKTGFMSFGDSVTMEAKGTDGSAPFGTINQQVVHMKGS